MFFPTYLYLESIIQEVQEAHTEQHGYGLVLVWELCGIQQALVHLNSSAQWYPPGSPSSSSAEHSWSITWLWSKSVGGLCAGEETQLEKSFVPFFFFFKWWFTVSYLKLIAKYEGPGLCGNRNYRVYKIWASRRSLDGMSLDSPLHCPILLYIFIFSTLFFMN